MESEEMQLLITSDGTPRGTVITDTVTGKPLSMVKELRLYLKAGDLCATAEIVLMKPNLKLSGTFKVVEESAP